MLLFSGSVIVLYVIVFIVKTETLNTTSILRQYILACGTEYLDGNNASYPYVPQNLQICPRCSRLSNCFYDNNCCPDLELNFPPSKCSRQIVYSYNDTFNVVNKYNVISKCPEEADAYLKHMCTKSQDVQDKLHYPPATSLKFSLSFKNKFCALCNNITDYVYWKINIFCNTQFSPFLNVSSLTVNAIENSCTVSYVPGDALSDIVQPCTESLLINKCNISGTWDVYNEDVDFACQSTTNPFPPYKNVFCYICNPPSRSEVPYDKCNMTGKWTKNDYAIAEACRDGDQSSGTYPYKNIYCYVCNVAHSTVPKKTFFVEVAPLGHFTYYLFNDENITQHPEYIEWPVYNSKQQPPLCNRMFMKLLHKFDCIHPVFLNIFERNSTVNFFKLTTGSCISSVQTNKYSLCKGNSSECVEIVQACEISPSYIFIQGTDQRISLSRCGGNFGNMNLHENGHPLVLDGVQPEWCKTMDCGDYNALYPLKYLACNCCSQRTDTDIMFELIPPAWNILSLSYYSPECTDDEVFDPQKNKCRPVSCYVGKELRKGHCEAVLPGYMYSMPVGYTLPFRFTPMNATEEIMPLYLQDHIEKMLNYSFTLCIYHQNDTNSFYVHIDISTDVYNAAIERNLLAMTSHLLDSVSTILRVTYDSGSLFYVNNSNSEECLQRQRPLLTNLLICPHVLFENNDYTVSMERNTADIHKHDVFQCYEFYIDDQKYLRLCAKDFERIKLQSDKTNFLPYSYVMMTCTVVSVVSLSLTLLTYILFSTLRTVPGKNIMSLVFSLLIYHISFLMLMLNDTTNNVFCQLTGILLHYSILSTLGSFTICTIHMFKVFGRDKLVSAVEASHGKNVFLIYAVFVYGCSAFVVIISVIVTTVLTGEMSIGYGRNGKCFLSYQESFIGTIMMPIMMTFIVNITLYSITIHKLNLMTNANTGMSCVSKVNKKELQIFMKLFVTTGCSWILFIIVAFVDKMFVYVIISCLNSLQGLYIFIAYVLNKRIFRMYKCKFASIGIITIQRRATTTTSLSNPRIGGNGGGPLENQL